jgi:fatty-acyl-CoA synthase
MADAGMEARTQVLVRAGFPIPLVKVGIVDADSHFLPPGRDQVGEIVLRCPWLTQGYYRAPEQSAELWRDGWLHTGDVGYVDEEGYVRITDRLKDVIKIGGEWISSLEIENALCQHPGVVEAAVVAVPDERWGDHPHAEVVLREGFKDHVGPRELHAHLHQFIERGSMHKRALLTRVRIVDALPKTSVGKLDKKALRAHVTGQPTASSPAGAPAAGPPG